MNKQTLMQALKYLASALITLLMIGFVIGCLVFTYYAVKAPKLSEKDLIATTSSKIFDSNNNLIADLGAEKRVNAETSEIPTDLVNAIVAIEDHRFFNHRGVDFIRIAGALVSNIRGGRQGGSTLTQQLIKLSYFSTSSSDATLSRKIQEAWLAAQLERKATKQQILTYYVNKVYMSNSNYGMQTAARSYYGKDLKDLSLHQTALLAGMPQAPNQYDPYTHPEAATNRRNLVLREMHDLKYITDEQYEQAKNTPVTDGLQSLKASTSYPAYMDNYLKEVIEQVEEETGYNVLTTGMEVYTNVNTDAQKKLWDIYNTGDYVAYPDDEMQVASTVMDVQTGKVIAQLGARHQSTNVSFGTNQAVETNRDFGSSMKPITDYAPALENEVYTSTAAPITDAPYNFPYSSTPVYNWDKKYYGGMTIQYAIQESRNVPAVKTLEAVGLDESLKFLNRIGINYPEMFYVNAFSSNTSKSGNEYGASSEKMAAAYAAFANGGIYHKPMYINKVVFSDGSSKEFSDQGTRAMKETTAYMMTEMMKTVLYSGTGRDAYISWLPQAGKTGTSNYTDEEIENYIKTSQFVAPDEMFVGYTRKYSMAVWTGYSNRLTPIVGDGFTVATSIYRSMMQYLAEGDHPGDWTMPEGLYRSGDYIFKNGTRSNWIPQSTQASSTIESSSSSSTSTTESESSSNENTNGTTNPNATQPNSSANSQQQNQPQQNPRRQQ